MIAFPAAIYSSNFIGVPDMAACEGGCVITAIWAKVLYITIGAPYDGMARELAALYATGQADGASVVAIANRHGVYLEGESQP